MSWLETYLKLLIVQYSDDENAVAEITNMLNDYKHLHDITYDFVPAFDVDNAWGDRLDIIGRIVGLNRIVKDVIPKTYFGFEGQNDAGGFGMSAFSDRNDDGHTDLVLDDEVYRFLLKAKIAKNTVNSKASGDNSTQDLIGFLFSSTAYIIDNRDMSFSMYIAEDSYNDNFRYARSLELLPRPQGVDLRQAVTYRDNGFGFSHNDNTMGFGQGVLARRVA